MGHGGQGNDGSLEWVRAGLIVRLRARRSELEEAIVARVLAMSGPVGDEDAEYVAGLQAAVTAAVEFSFAGIEQGEAWEGPIPRAAVVQAHRAARYGVSLDTVLRRYAAGERLLGYFVMDEADRFPGDALRDVLRTQGVLVDRLMAAIGTEYMREVDRAGGSSEQHRAEHVQRLLAGTLVGPVELDYELDAWHVGLIATGADAAKIVEGFAEGLRCQLLLVPRDESVWAWLGGQRRLMIADIERLFSDNGRAGVSLAVGEVASGVDGWRMTHWQAQRALWVALRDPQAFTRYADVLLLASALQDDVLARSLKEVYLSPLGSKKNGAAVSYETLRTYFAVGRNAAKAAASLEVDRHTVERRLHRIEERLGRSLHTCQAELEVALRLDTLGAAAGTDPPS
jgi:PucR C-terminal helix-turn-helix domain/GGDEF-like domain